jgi:DNA-binding CsgD family transcriptional regulator
MSQEHMNAYGLSKREKEAMDYLAQGLMYKEIAATMFISEATVKTHIARIYAKTSSNSKVDAINKLR